MARWAMAIILWDARRLAGPPKTCRSSADLSTNPGQNVGSFNAILAVNLGGPCFVFGTVDVLGCVVECFSPLLLFFVADVRVNGGVVLAPPQMR
ncbi:hypothetical protein B0T19DRAFT_425608 [Cercophora scortea]|uniref:Uncharacterized protein n=1 Tax=Cercophora scortea TaxID=314031 RepID=A0AAE0IE60_9PEZI|nr:hypothetical protein B0T19DRAFT_425608 [Cercophora scortea]